MQWYVSHRILYHIIVTLYLLLTLVTVIAHYNVKVTVVGPTTFQLSNVQCSSSSVVASIFIG